MQKVIPFSCCFLFLLHLSQAQDFVGAGNSSGISVTASDQYQDDQWQGMAAAQGTVDGAGLEESRFQAARFLLQSTMGFDQSHIDEVLNLGIEGWLDDQIQKPKEKVLPKLQEIFAIVADSLTKYGHNPPNRPDYEMFSYAWWEVNMKNNDLLRHRIAETLSEILVISKNSDLSKYGFSLASYYDIFVEHAFGNYRDIMQDVTLHPAMGYFLSHANNPKSDTTIGRFPDENYARELMQLFTIGLFELNNDGTRKQQNGADIPTYDNEDVIEYSRIFTGLSYGALYPGSSATLKFGINKNQTDLTVPMIMYDADDPNTNRDDEDQHENGEKILLNGEVVPDGQTGLDDISDALDNLFNHPNVGPFLAYRLIQRLVTSNPSPAYVQRVAEKFNNNGSGVRGDMTAVIKAILLDGEARSCQVQNDHSKSHLKPPLLRYTQFVRMVEKMSPSNYYWNTGKNFLRDAGQEILSAPSVFNFYLPIDAPSGPIEDQGLVAPEFKLHDAKFGIGFINQIHDWTHNGNLMRISEREFNDETEWDITNLLPIAQDPEEYIHWIDQNITHGRLSDGVRQEIRSALKTFHPSRNNYLEDRVRLGMYLALMTADYNIIE